ADRRPPRSARPAAVALCAAGRALGRDRVRGPHYRRTDQRARSRAPRQELRDNRRQGRPPRSLARDDEIYPRRRQAFADQAAASGAAQRRSATGVVTSRIVTSEIV